MAFSGITQDLRATFGSNLTTINGELEVDVTVRELPRFKATTTTKRVESGSDTTDNVRIEPIELALEIILADDTLNAATFGLAGQSADEKISLFEGYWRAGQRNEIETDFRKYENMVITSFEVNRTASTANAGFIAIQLKEVRVIETTLFASPADAVSDTVAGTTDQGFKNTTAADPANQSFISSVVDSLGSFF